MKTPIEILWDALEHHGCNPRGQAHKFSALCPAHEDRSPSLHCMEGREQKAVVQCFAGCRYDQIAEAIGLCVKDLFPHRGPFYFPRRRIVLKKKPRVPAPVGLILNAITTAGLEYRCCPEVGMWRADCPIDRSDERRPIWLVDPSYTDGRENHHPYMFCANGCSVDAIISELAHLARKEGEGQ
jgi:hypothetical protein